MLLRFSKMHGLGNDFMVIDLVTQYAHLSSRLIRQWSNRHTGVGFDQLLVVEVPTRPDVDFRYRIFNADGTEVEQCGNGARCFARFVLDKRLTTKQQIRVETKSGIIELHVRADGYVRVNMGLPRFELEEIPLNMPARQANYHLQLAQQSIAFSALSMGNPHAVMRVDNIELAAVTHIGPQVETHPVFPKKVNVGFLQVDSMHSAQLRVWERGVGETQACGSGACAAAVVAIKQGWMQSPVDIELPGGRLTIEWQGEGQAVYMTGPATRVYEGHIRL